MPDAGLESNPLPSTTSTTFDTFFNEDTFLRICGFLPDIRDILCLRRTCTTICGWTRSHSCWLSALSSLRLHVTIPPVEARRIPSMHTNELEHLVVRHFRLELNWTHQTPTPFRIRRIPLPPGGSPGPFSCVKLVAGGQLLLCGTAEEDDPVYCMRLQGQDARLAVIGRWRSDEVSWTAAELRSFDGKFLSSQSSELTVVALFTVQDPENGDHKYSSVAMWRLDPGMWPVRSTRIPPLNFKTEIDRFTVAGNLVACWTGDRVHVIEYTPGSDNPIRQGIFNFHLPNDTPEAEVKLLPPSHILIASKLQVTLYSLPHLHDTADVNDFAACRSPVTQLWNMPLDAHTNRFRLFAIPDENFLFPYDDEAPPMTLTPFNLLTARTFFAAIPFRDQAALSISVLLKGVKLPPSLYNPGSFALIGLNGKRGVWLHSVTMEGGSRLVRMQLVDFWGMGNSPRSMTWAELNEEVDVTQLVEGKGNVLSVEPFQVPKMYTFDEAMGRVVFSMEEALMVYDFAPTETTL